MLEDKEALSEGERERESAREISATRNRLIDEVLNDIKRDKFGNFDLDIAKLTLKAKGYPFDAAQAYDEKLEADLRRRSKASPDPEKSVQIAFEFGPFKYEADRLVIDGRKAIEFRKMLPNHHDVLTERARQNKEHVNTAFDLELKVNRAFHKWAQEQEAKGTPALDLTFGAFITAQKSQS